MLPLKQIGNQPEARLPGPALSSTAAADTASILTNEFDLINKDDQTRSIIAAARMPRPTITIRSPDREVTVRRGRHRARANLSPTDDFAVTRKSRHVLQLDDQPDPNRAGEFHYQWTSDTVTGSGVS